MMQRPGEIERTVSKNETAFCGWCGGEIPLGQGEQRMKRRRGFAYSAAMCPSCIEIRDEATREFVAENKQWLHLCSLFEERFKGERGTKTLEEDGIVIERRFRKQKSNTGKRFLWLMDFHVTKDGKTEVLSDPNGPNRCNDPGRNYGLGRE